MKTQIITLFTALLLSAGITGITRAATTKNQNITILNNTGNIGKIEVHGNVTLYVSDGSKDEVKVYNKYYSDNALVQGDKGTLRISSYKPEKLVVWVTAKDLRSISAYDNVEVKSFGSISRIEFDVDLHDNAKATLNLDAFNTTICTQDKATASLHGYVNQYHARLTSSNSIEINDLHTVTASTTPALFPPAETDTSDLADL